MRWRGSCIWFVLLLTFESSLGSLPLARYRYTRAVDGSLSQQELVAIDLDGHMWKAIGTVEIDLRVADQDGRAVPHLMRRAGIRESRLVRDLRASRIDALSDLEGNQIELRVSLEKHAEGVNVISFVTPLKDFDKSLTVWGIAADGSESMIVEQARIYDYSRFADVRTTDVVLPEDSTAFRAFRVQVNDSVDEAQLPLRSETRHFEGKEVTHRQEHTRVLTRPFRMDAIRLYRQRLVEVGMVPRVERQSFASLVFRQEQDPVATVIEIEHDGSPLTALALACTDKNFSRHAKVEIPIRRDGRETWRQIATGQLSRISFRNFLHASLHLSFPETRSQRFRLTLFDHDNPPLQELSLSGEGPVWQAVFLADPDNTYSIYYGAESPPQPPRYDLTPLERLLRQEHEPTTRTLAPAEPNPHFRKPGFLAGETTTRLLFAFAILVMVAVLAAGLYRASRQIPQ